MNFSLAALLAVGLAAPQAASAALLASYEFTNGGVIGVASSSDTDTSSTASSWTPPNLAPTMNGTPPATFINAGFSSAPDGQAFVRGSGFTTAGGFSSPNVVGTTTASNINPATSPAFHEFTLTVDGLQAGEALDLTTITYQHRADVQSRGWIEFYADVTGFALPSQRLSQYTSFNQSFTGTPVPPTITLPSGGAFSGLTNGDSVTFRVYVNVTIASTGNVQRLDNVRLNGEIVQLPIPEPTALAIVAMGGVASLLARRSAR